MTCPPQADLPRVCSQVEARVWDGVLRRLGQELPTLALEAWIGPLALEPTAEGLRLVCPSAFHRERVRERYLARIEALAAEACGAPVAVALEVGTAARPHPQARLQGVAPVAGPAVVPTGERPRVIPVRLPAPGGGDARPEPPLHDFTSFVVGASNALAREACLSLARGRQLAVSPLYLVAGSGLGKSHLAGAVVAEVRARGTERVAYVSAEQFTNELMASIRAQRTEPFKRRYRDDCDVFVFEDVQFLRGKRQTQLELLHTLEHLARRGARLLLTAERLPKEIPDLDPRLASRLASGLCAEIEPPDAALRREIVRTRAAASGVALPARCLERLVEAVPGSVRDLEAALVQLVASASLLKRPIDPELVEVALRKVAPRDASVGFAPERIAELVAAHFGTTAGALASRSRRRDVLLPRQLAMYLCTRHTDASLERIGRAFGRNHPSVGNAVRAIERALAGRPALRERLAALLLEVEAITGGARKGPRRAGR